MNDIAERLHLERDAIVTTDVDDGLRYVHRIVRRRRRRSSAVGVAAVGGLMAAGFAGVGLFGSAATEVVVTDTATPNSVVPEPGTTTPTVDTAPDSSIAEGDPEAVVDVAPSIGEPVVGSAVQTGPVDVTEELQAVAGDDVAFDFQVPWEGGFLIGRTGNSEQPWKAFFSADGQTWEPRDIRADDIQASGVFLAAGDRLVVPGVQWDSVGRTPVIAASTDLETWTVEELPVAVPDNLPALVEVMIGPPPALRVHERGWITTVNRSLEINTIELATQRLGRPVTGVSQNITDQGFRLLVDAAEPGGTPELLNVTWDELEDELGGELVDAVRSPAPFEVWTGTWDGSAPVRHDIPTELVDSWIRDFVAVGDGFVVVQSFQEVQAGGPPDVTTELVSGVVTADGSLAWTVLDPPISESVVEAFPLDGDLGVFAETNDGALVVYRVDTASQTWTQIEVPDLPESARYFTPTETGAVLLDTAPEEQFNTEPTTGTIEKNGLRYTWRFEFPNSSYELISISTGDVLVEESIDISEIRGSFDLAFEHLIGGLDATTISDPQNGEVLMEITADEMNATTSPVDSPQSEPLIVATSDGIAWFVDNTQSVSADLDLFDVARQMTVSGGRLLLHTKANEWFVVDLQ